MDLSHHDVLNKVRQEIAAIIETPICVSSLISEHPGLTGIIYVTSGLSFVPMAKPQGYSASWLSFILLPCLFATWRQLRV